MMQDKITSLGVSRGISPVATAADNTAVVSQILDLQDKHAAAFILTLGAIPDADATFVALMEHGDVSNLSDAALVPDDELILLESTVSFTFADDNEVRKIGYRGAKRYIRLTVTPANNASATLIGGVWVWHSHLAPVAQPT